MLLEQAGHIFGVIIVHRNLSHALASWVLVFLQHTDGVDTSKIVLRFELVPLEHDFLDAVHALGQHDGVAIFLITLKYYVAGAGDHHLLSLPILSLLDREPNRHNLLRRAVISKVNLTHLIHHLLSIILIYQHLAIQGVLLLIITDADLGRVDLAVGLVLLGLHVVVHHKDLVLSLGHLLVLLVGRLVLVLAALSCLRLVFRFLDKEIGLVQLKTLVNLCCPWLLRQPSYLLGCEAVLLLAELGLVFLLDQLLAPLLMRGVALVSLLSMVGGMVLVRCPL